MQFGGLIQWDTVVHIAVLRHEPWQVEILKLKKGVPEVGHATVKPAAVGKKAAKPEPLAPTRDDLEPLTLLTSETFRSFTLLEVQVDGLHPRPQGLNVHPHPNGNDLPGITSQRCYMAVLPPCWITTCSKGEAVGIPQITPGA